MKTIYVPKREDNETLIPGIDTALALLVPDKQLDKYFFAIFVHGVGERSNGKLDNLKNLVEGFDYNGDGIRDSGFVIEDMRKAVDQFGIIIAIVTYEDETYFEPPQVNWVYDYVKSKFPIHDKMMLPGFSLGGWSVFRYISSSVANANRVALAVPVAATNGLISNNKAIPGHTGVVVHAFSCDDDPRVHYSNTVNQVNAINSANPLVKAQYTLFRKKDHSIEGAWNLTPPVAEGGQGFTNAAENIYQLFTDIVLSGKPRQMKSVAAIPPGPVVIDPLPVADLQPVLEYKLIGNTVYLDGSKSTGMKSAKLAAVAVPDGVKIWNTSIEGGGSAVGKISLTTPGAYKFRLTIYPETSYKGTPATADVEVVIGTAQPEPFKPTHTIVRSDGTKEQIRLETL